MTNDPYQRNYFHLGQYLTLTVIRSRRKTLALHVLPGCQPAEARVPMKCAWREIDAFIEDRLDWWARATSQLSDVPEPARFLDATMHEFQGENTPLDVIQSSKNQIGFESGRLRLYSKKPDCHKTNQAIFFNFAKARSERLFPARVAECLQSFPIRVEPKGLRIRRMKARWGSCSQAGEICLNSLLVQKATAAIDLVITHELCHLEHFRHDKEFYKLLSDAMPDWKRREKLLLPLKTSSDPGQVEPRERPLAKRHHQQTTLGTQLMLF